MRLIVAESVRVNFCAASPPSPYTGREHQGDETAYSNSTTTWSARLGFECRQAPINQLAGWEATGMPVD
jgi:hypothetical protein